jgi:hypothetical protein
MNLCARISQRRRLRKRAEIDDCDAVACLAGNGDQYIIRSVAHQSIVVLRKRDRQLDSCAQRPQPAVENVNAIR